MLLPLVPHTPEFHHGGTVGVAILYSAQDSATTVPVLDALAPMAKQITSISVDSRVFHNVDKKARASFAESLFSIHSPSLVAEIDGDTDWLWLLPTDARPAPDALSALLAAAAGSSRVAVVGPKLLRAEDPRVLVGMGHRITMWGRSPADTGAGAVDQGQCDERSDVIGVPLSGMLVRREVLKRIGGLDSTLAASAAGLDVCWRAHLCGHRVLIAPRARLAVDEHVLTACDAPSGHPAADHARAQAQVALARASRWRLPTRAVAMLVTAVASLLLMVGLRRPAAVRVAWAEALAVVAMRRWWRARRCFAGRVEVTERDLASLFEPARAGRLRARLLPLDGGNDPPRTPIRPAGSAGASVDGERSVGSGRWWSMPLIAAVMVAVVVTGLRWAETATVLDPRGWGVRAAEVFPVPGGAATLWSAWSLAWSGAGLGQPGQGPSWFLPLSALSWALERLPGGPDAAHGAAMSTAVILVAAMPLSVLVAYFATAAVAPSRGVRAVLALAWAALSPLSMALEQGRVGPVVVHLLAPVLVTAVLASVRPGPRGTSAAFGSALVLAAMVWFVPILAGLGPVLALLLVFRARGWSRLRAVVLAVVPAALLGPHLVQLVADPVLIFGGAGATAAGSRGMPLGHALLLQPPGPVPITIWWVLPGWALALVAALGRTHRAGAATALVLAAIGGVGLALFAARLNLGALPPGYAASGLPVTMWPGTFVSLAAAALLCAAGLGASRLTEAADSAGRPTSIAVVALAISLVAVVAAHGVLAMQPVKPAVTVAGAPVPAVVAERLAGVDQLRLIDLQPVPTQRAPASGGPPDYQVRYDLVGHEPLPWLRDRARDLAHDAPSSADPDASAVATLLTPLDSAASEGALVERALADLAVGYVQVRAGQDHPLVQQIDRVPALTRVSSAPETVLWRVLPDDVVPRVHQGEDDGSLVSAVASHGPHSATEADLGPAGTYVVAAQTQAWSELSMVTVDGVEVAAEPGFPARYAVPDGADAVSIEVPLAFPRWWLIIAVTALVSAFFAVPWARSPQRRSV